MRVFPSQWHSANTALLPPPLPSLSFPCPRQVGAGTYVAYPKKADETIGSPLALNAPSSDFLATRSACDWKSNCIGLTWDPVNQWQGFKGMLWEGAVGKVRVVGNALNSWVRIPTGRD